MDEMLFSLAIKRKDASARTAIQTVKNLLRLRHNLDLLQSIQSPLKALECELTRVIADVLKQEQWSKLMEWIDRYFDTAHDRYE